MVLQNSYDYFEYSEMLETDQKKIKKWVLRQRKPKKNTSQQTATKGFNQGEKRGQKKPIPPRRGSWKKKQYTRNNKKKEEEKR